MDTSAALLTPLAKKLKGKRVVLASASPRRSQILKDILGYELEVVPSSFDEDLPHTEFADNLGAYASATAEEKGLQVYKRLVEESLVPGATEAPDLVISADSIVVTADDMVAEQRILEKPVTKKENLRMLEELNGKKHTVYTAVCVVYPVLNNPGYESKNLLEHTHVFFNDNPQKLLEAYVESGEGLDRAGGFAIQEKGGILVQRIQGDFNTVVGFPASAFYRWLTELVQNDELSFDL